MTEELIPLSSGSPRRFVALPISMKSKVELRPVAMRLGVNAPLPAQGAEKLFAASLGESHRWEEPSRATRSALDHVVTRLRHEADIERARLKESESTLGALRAARRRATQEGTLRQRLKAAKDRLASLKVQNAQEFPIRMAERKFQIEQARLDDFTAQKVWGQLVVCRCRTPDGVRPGPLE